MIAEHQSGTRRLVDTAAIIVVELATGILAAFR
jgi:hypothetical protein